MPADSPASRPRLNGRLFRFVAAVSLLAVVATAAALVLSGFASRTARPAMTLRASVVQPVARTLPVPARPGAGSSAPKVSPATVASPAASQVVAQRPVSIGLPSGTEMAVEPASTDRSGVLQVPDDIVRAGWWDGGSRLGDPYGAIVVAAHVDSFTQGLGKFAELLQIREGDVVSLESHDLAQRFRVVSAELVPKASLAADSSLFSPQGGERLVLITCGGAFDPDLGGYQDNMVVVAVPVGDAQPLSG